MFRPRGSFVSDRKQLRAASDPPLTIAKVKARYPHDAKAFTQGLTRSIDHRLYESTGRYGESSVREVETRTGLCQSQHLLASRYFGEGLTMHQGELYQLTWREGTVFVYNPRQLSIGAIRTHAWSREGWGITSTGTQLVISDGSDILYFVEPVGFTVSRELAVQKRVRAQLQAVTALNELEWVDGLIYANVWHTSRIAVIDPVTGLVLSELDCEALTPANSTAEMTLNGIAYDRDRKSLLVTGKLWPWLYEIALR